jgi:GNAT superfamily N-acetyltransferase
MVEETRGDFLLSDDRSLVDIAAVHAYLKGSYWAEGVPEDVVTRSIENSLCFGIYKEGRQVAFARVITDYATFGYLADVYVLEEFRGQGLSKWLISAVTSHNELAGLRRWFLFTRDAHSLYSKFGFTALAAPERGMEIVKRNPYIESVVPGD